MFVFGFWDLVRAWRDILVDRSRRPIVARVQAFHDALADVRRIERQRCAQYLEGMAAESLHSKRAEILNDAARALRALPDRKG